MFIFDNFPNKYASYTEFVNKSFAKKNIINGPNFYSGSLVYTAGIVATFPSIQVFEDLIRTVNTLSGTWAQLRGEDTVNQKSQEPNPPPRTELVAGITSEYPDIKIEANGNYTIPSFTFQYLSERDMVFYRKSTTEKKGNVVTEAGMNLNESLYNGKSIIGLLDFRTVEGNRGIISGLEESIISLEKTPNAYSVELAVPLSIVATDSITISYGQKVVPPTGSSASGSDDTYMVLTEQPQFSAYGLPWTGYPVILIFAKLRPKTLTAFFSYKNSGEPAPSFTPFERIYSGPDQQFISPLATLSPSSVSEENLIKHYDPALSTFRDIKLPSRAIVPFALFSTPVSNDQRSYLDQVNAKSKLQAYSTPTGVQFFPLKVYSKAKDLTEEQQLAVAKQVTFDVASLYTEFISTGIKLPYTLPSLSNIDLASVRLLNKEQTKIYKENKDYSFTYSAPSGIGFGSGTVSGITLDSNTEFTLVYHQNPTPGGNEAWKRLAVNQLPVANDLYAWLNNLREQSEAYTSSQSGTAKQFLDAITAVERVVRMFSDIVAQIKIIIASIETLLNALTQLSTINIYVLYATCSSTEEVKQLFLSAQGIPQKDTLYYMGGIAILGSPSPESIQKQLNQAYGVSDITSTPSPSFVDKYKERVLQLNPEVSNAIQEFVTLLSTYSKGIIN